MESEKIGRFNLEELIPKHRPNKIQEKGVNVKIGKTQKEYAKRKREENQGLEEDLEGPEQNPVIDSIIVNALEPNYDYTKVLDTLKNANIFSVKTKKLESQMNEQGQRNILDSIQERVLENIEEEMDNTEDNAQEKTKTELLIENEEEVIEKTPKEKQNAEVGEKGKSEKMPKELFTENAELENPEKLEKEDIPKKSSKKEEQKTYGVADLRKEDLMGERIMDLLPFL